MNRIRKHLSYANVAATMALVFAMSGSAIAAKHYLLSSTKQISPKVLASLASSNKAQFNKLIATATAANALNAGHATTADAATKAKSADSATTATSAGHATTADTATSAGDASTLGGQPASAYARTGRIGTLSMGFENGWGNGAEFGAATYHEDQFGIVHLFGAVFNAGAATTNSFTTLPEGLRPDHEIDVPAAFSGSTVGVVRIEPNGVIHPESGSTKFVDLEGITFLAAP